MLDMQWGKALTLLGCLTGSSSYEIRGFLPARTDDQRLIHMNSYPDGFHFGIVST